MVEYTRCTRCRNPVRTRQRRVQDPSGDCYHDDCWAAACADAQHAYAERIRDEGPLAILMPYVVRLGEGSMLRDLCEQKVVDPVPAVAP